MPCDAQLNLMDAEMCKSVKSKIKNSSQATSEYEKREENQKKIRKWNRICNDSNELHAIFT